LDEDEGFNREWTPMDANEEGMGGSLGRDRRASAVGNPSAGLKGNTKNPAAANRAGLENQRKSAGAYFFTT
jgi:hypothetical protein